MSSMSITGEPVCAVSGNASEIPDSESGETGIYPAPQWPNETVEEDEEA